MTKGHVEVILLLAFPSVEDHSLGRKLRRINNGFNPVIHGIELGDHGA